MLSTYKKAQDSGWSFSSGLPLCERTSARQNVLVKRERCLKRISLHTTERGGDKSTIYINFTISDHTHITPDFFLFDSLCCGYI